MSATFTIIEHWRENVANSSSISRPPATFSPKYQTRLQARLSSHPPQRPPLNSIHPNSQSKRKWQASQHVAATQPQHFQPSKRRKMSPRKKENQSKENKEKGAPWAETFEEGGDQGSMSQEEDRVLPVQARRRPGRPKKDAQLKQQRQRDPLLTRNGATGDLNSVPLAIFSSLAGPTPSLTQPSFRTTQSRPTSPSKSGTKTANQPRSSKNVDFTMLSTCSPSLLPVTLLQARKRGGLPPTVEHLFQQLRTLPAGLVPFELKSSYEADANTPMKSRPAPHATNYLQKGQTPFPPASLPVLKAIATKVVDEAAWTDTANSHERQWGKVVSNLMLGLELLPYGQKFRFMNIENCSINPVDIRPSLPGDMPLTCDVSLADGDSGLGSKEPQTMARMIDYTFGLKLGEDEDDLVTAAFAQTLLNRCSLNQTLDSPKTHPLFLDIELKKALSGHDPRVQLAIWKLAWLKKMQMHGWDHEVMPMPGITITGHIWQYYLFYQDGPKLIMMGPEAFGTTAHTTGVWEILYRLDVLIKWGLGDFHDWVERKIMTWARNLAEDQRPEP